MNSPVDTDRAAASPSASASPAVKANAQPHEARVVITGTRSRKDADGSELFTEETATVLVFPDGAVVRLASPVTQWQLLFLTNTANKREVIAQVAGKRPFQSGTFYVELQFTEAATGFWGFEFPSAGTDGEPTESKTSFSPASVAATAIPQTDVIAGGKPTNAFSEQGTVPGATVPKPLGSGELEQLRREVERLRGEVSSLRKAAPKSEAEKPSRNEPEPLGQTDGEGISAVPVVAPGITKRAIPRMALPSVAVTSAQTGFNALEALAIQERSLPKAALKSEPPAPKRAGGPVRVAILSALLLAAAGVTGYQYRGPLIRLSTRWGDRTQHSGGKPSASPAAATPARAPAVPVPASGNSHKGAAALPGKTEAETVPTAIPSPAAPVSRPEGSDASPINARTKEIKVKDERIGANPASAQSGGALVKHSGDRAIESPSDAAAPGNISTPTPPKLLKAVRAIPPPEAVRNFVTGNVIVDALVSAEGRVTSARPLSGPDILRQAAIDTVKRYSYDPATRSGKAVAAHVQVTVQFWYEP